MGIHGLVSVGVPAGQPVWLLYIKGAILVLSVVILGLAAWSISIFGGYNGVLVYGTGAGGLVIFVVIKTWIVYGGALALEIWAPQYFYRIAAFVLYILSIIFWLSAWAWSASLAGLWLGYNTLGGVLPKEYKDEGSALGACAGLGALVW
ncbi:hypothetical protein B0T26DRAFT_528008 [Lasiosphaeria miniovina]|uniref:Uncharacterized protein n=1 Tax=Lasiosphaeria miniovina TaxID=1954250 RepID=A0AA40DI65_9PEZI|nr:uncharacterized protein B0T26DRAFT_528008 [Lasiosphaeria miniovina]KAK0701707.1 hypothetical protein B0T26DRAFT_528008 [Lasiosphaeria miniovina]